MMKTSSTSVFSEKNYNYGQRERHVNKRKTIPLLFASLGIATLFIFFCLSPPIPFKFTPKQSLDSVQTNLDLHVVQEKPSVDHHIIDLLPKLPKRKKKKKKKKEEEEEEEECDLFKGRWVPELRGTLYTNSSCATIPDSKNCFKHGRMDKDFLNWRWKPEKCELPRFDPKAFLEMVRGKKMAFIGDSVARNHMESLLCLLSSEEIPQDIYKDAEDRFRTWYFPRHDFTLVKLWSKFLIAEEERMVNGTGSSIFDLYLDKVENTWAQRLPEIDYAIVSDGHWFFRVLYLHQHNTLFGCVYCNKPNVTQYNISFAVRMAFRTVLKYINSCENCNTGLVTLVRTFAPAHFENGAWNTGGYCNRTSPLNEEEINWKSFDWEMRNIQLEEIERARKEGGKKGRRFGLLDVTRAMLMRPDGHPGNHWDNQWMKDYNDCVHWCMPGPVDYWNDFLKEVMRSLI